MRILGFAIRWPKLKQKQFTTFRFERKDRDWQVDEVVQIRIKPRSKGGGDILGTAKIVDKVRRDGEAFITDDEANADGFQDKVEMCQWMLKNHTPEQLVRPLHKLTLEWL
jgi:hypothetical protein